MGLRDRILALLDRGEGGTDDPESPVEVAVVKLFNGPLAVTYLRERGIDASLVEGYDPVTDVRSEARIMVPRRDVERARQALATMP